MKALCLLVVYLFATPLTLNAEPNARVRPLDPWAADAMRLGVERSALVRELVARVQSSDLIVHIETRTAMPFGAAGTTRLAAATTSHRYVRIVLFRDPLPVNRVAILAHELQHAREIAESTARDTAGMRRLFTAIGRAAPGEATVFETDAALHVTRVVWFEVHGDTKNAARVKQKATDALSGRNH
jgi:hypothetical protein